MTWEDRLLYHLPYSSPGNTTPVDLAERWIHPWKEPLS
jgi:hypothetical protein